MISYGEAQTTIQPNLYADIFSMAMRRAPFQWGMMRIKDI
jgi:hypothetical protein